MRKIKALVVDDEEAARDILCSLLHRSALEFEFIKTAENVPDAVTEIKRSQPDLVFLDVQMPNYAGYEIISFFDEITFEIIFVTAFDQYAIKAFELSAVDYLVKPIERIRLNESLERLQDRLQQKTDADNYKVLLESVKGKELGKIIISELREGTMVKHILPLKDIVALEAMRAYTQIYLMDGNTLLVSRNIKQLEERLPMDTLFFRAHRSWIVNIDQVQSLKPGSNELKLSENVVAKISKKALSHFQERTKSTS